MGDIKESWKWHATDITTKNGRSGPSPSAVPDDADRSGAIPLNFLEKLAGRLTGKRAAPGWNDIRWDEGVICLRRAVPAVQHPASESARECEFVVVFVGGECSAYASLTYACLATLGEAKLFYGACAARTIPGMRLAVAVTDLRVLNETTCRYILVTPSILSETTRVPLDSLPELHRLVSTERIATSWLSYECPDRSFAKRLADLGDRA
jgi:hypothetical protein